MVEKTTDYRLFGVSVELKKKLENIKAEIAADGHPVELHNVVKKTLEIGTRHWKDYKDEYNSLPLRKRGPPKGRPMPNARKPKGKGKKLQ